MGKVKSALEIALEKAGAIGELTEEEKEKIKDEETVKAILGEFFYGKIDANGLWQKIKGLKPSLRRTAQFYLADSLGPGNAQMELELKKQGILAIETLKEAPKTAMIESCLNEIMELQAEFEQMKKDALDEVRKQIEANPQWRMQPVRTQDGKTVMKVVASVDETVKAKFNELLAGHEEHFNSEFGGLIEELKNSL